MRRIDIPVDEPVCLGFWDGGICVSQGDPNPARVAKLDPQTGRVLCEIPTEGFDPCGLGFNPLGSTEVGDELWVCDEYAPGIFRFKTDATEQRAFLWPEGGAGYALAATRDGVWHLGGCLVKHDFAGKVMDWGERPFGDASAGVAWDGKNLWALDRKNKRICMIEKTASGREITAALAAERKQGK
jgi:hypothetical protein